MSDQAAPSKSRIVRPGEPLVIELAQVIGQQIPDAGFKAVNDAALMVVAHLRRTRLIPEAT